MPIATRSLQVALLQPGRDRGTDTPGRDHWFCDVVTPVDGTPRHLQPRLSVCWGLHAPWDVPS